MNASLVRRPVGALLGRHSLTGRDGAVRWRGDRVDDPRRCGCRARDEHDCADPGIGSGHRPLTVRRCGQAANPGKPRQSAFGRVADGDLSPEHRIAHGGLALESGREVERPGRPRIFRRECGARGGANSPFLWISAAAPRSHARRRDRHRRVVAIDGWRHKLLLEEQSVFDAGVHR